MINNEVINFLFRSFDFNINPIEMPMHKYIIFHAIGKAILGGVIAGLFNVGYHVCIDSD